MKLKTITIDKKYIPVILTLLVIFIFSGCFDYKLKVGKLAFHKSFMLRNDKEALQKFERGRLKRGKFLRGGIIEYLEPGTVLEPIKYEKSWYYVKTPKGNRGWILEGDVYRTPVYETIYDRSYRSQDNPALTVTLPLVVIIILIILMFNNRFTRTVIFPVLILIMVIGTAYIVGYERASYDRFTHPFKTISEYLKDKDGTVMATDYIWTNRLNYWTDYNRHFSYYSSINVPCYNCKSRIRYLIDPTDPESIHGVYIVTDSRYYELSQSTETIPKMIESGKYPKNWRIIMDFGPAKLFYAR